MPTVLIVDDEPNIVELAEMYFRRDGFDVERAASGSAAVAAVERLNPDLLLLDIMLPDLDGWEVCRRLRAAGNRLPIILLTARDDDIDKVLGLELGADDYVTKPFNPREVVARARALLRRQKWDEATASTPPAVVRVGNLRMDEAGRQAYLGEENLTLRPREWELLLTLARHAGQALSRDRLLDDVWGYEYYGDTRTVDVHVASLRDKLRGAEDPGIVIETVWGIGYRLVGSP